MIWTDWDNACGRSPASIECLQFFQQVQYYEYDISHIFSWNGRFCISLSWNKLQKKENLLIRFWPVPNNHLNYVNIMSVYCYITTMLHLQYSSTLWLLSFLFYGFVCYIWPCCSFNHTSLMSNFHLVFKPYLHSYHLKQQGHEQRANCITTLITT